MKKHYLQVLSVTLGAATLAVTILVVGNVFAGPPAPPDRPWSGKRW